MTAPLNRFALNLQQKAAVDHDGSRLMIIAGAGTGKTATISARAARLIRDGLMPHKIWLITFCREAADELRVRSSSCVKDGDLITAGTYHALAVRLLRRWGSLIDWQGDDILDSSDQLALIKQLIAGLKLSLPDVKPRLIADFFSYCSNSSRSLEDVAAAGTYRRLQPHLGNLHLLQNAYYSWKQEHGYADYDDLLFGLLELISTAGGRVLSDCSHLMVDEYQDTSPLQQQVLEAILAHGIPCTVVGDPMQAVYSWRGCDPHLMSRREGWDVLTLALNYRSPQPVLDLACRVVADQSSVRLRSGISGPDPQIKVLPTEEAEARHVLDYVQRLLASGVPAYEIAVLYRKAVHALRLEVALTAADVPYIKHGGRRLTEAAHVKDMLALLRLVFSDHERSLRRVLQLCPGIGAVTADKMAELWPQCRPSAKALDAVLKLRNCIDAMRTAYTPADVYAAALAWYSVRVDLEPYRRKELDQLGQSCASASSLRSWLDGFTLEPVVSVGTSRRGVVLSTVHTAKGKEFLHVIIIRCATGLFPQQSEADLEEMRLLHIAITRSAGSLLITRPAFAQFPDSGWRYCCTPSVLQ